MRLEVIQNLARKTKKAATAWKIFAQDKQRAAVSLVAYSCRILSPEEGSKYRIWDQNK